MNTEAGLVSHMLFDVGSETRRSPVPLLGSSQAAMGSDELGLQDHTRSSEPPAAYEGRQCGCWAVLPFLLGQWFFHGFP